ncbi:MAG TPA: aldehyde ferredoxin oxidoreductase family protein [Chloroflexota bacterium]|nr:aldehyde ferredoxin oxidoreductase family protein [Chloroflexota bacterium]HZU08217.1 aldehyde ferredoxin oxidoreductase family protein [Chloroflexota bacterium]
MAYGYWNRILRVNLTERTWRVEAPGETFFERYVGGRAFIGYYLLTETRAGVDPFGPENPLIFAPGVVTAAPLPGAGRHSVGAKSPLNDGFGEAESGGYWGAELKKAGYDALIVEGQAETPTWLWITADGVEFRDARPLWGRTTGETQEAIRRELGDALVRVAQIGPAGENRVRFACVVNDLKDVAGRTGMGAVMGAKRLKAIAVRGRAKVPLADPAAIHSLARWVAATLMEKHRTFHEFGTGAGMTGKHLAGAIPTRNYQEGLFPGVERINAEAIARTVRVGMESCYACSVRCKKVVEVTEGPYRVDRKYGGPEYEALAALGPTCGVDDLIALCKANELCNALGLDVISTGTTIAWAMEAYERGLLSPAEADGLDLRFGNPHTVVTLVERIAHRQGLGDLLAEGSVRAARQLGRGTEAFTVHVKGLEVAMHDPRHMPNMLRNYPVAPTGGDHTGTAYEERGFRNVIGLCHFLNYDREQVLALTRAITGWTDFDEQALQTVARRGITLARLVNLREGHGRHDDVLPPRLHEPLPAGPLKDRVITREEVAAIVREYYLAQGWDPETGVPTVETLRALDLPTDLLAAVSR